jgi:hypothetical protein
MTEPDATSMLAGCELARKAPELFRPAVEEYAAIVQLAVEDSVSVSGRRAFSRVRRLARRLGQADSLPHDLIAIHLSALAHLVGTKPQPMARACVRHSRLLLVKLIGELALYYREQARGGKAMP